MKLAIYSGLAFALMIPIPASGTLYDQYKIEARTKEAGRILDSICVKTESERIHIVRAYAWQRDICVEFVEQDARQLPSYAWAIDEADFNDRCERAAAGVSVLPSLEKGVGQ